MAAPHLTTLDLAYTPPFDWDWLCAYLAARAIPGVESVADGRYARTIRTGWGIGMLSVAPAAGDALAARIRLPGPAQDLAPRLAGLFDLAADPATIAAALSADPFMAGLVAARPGLRVPGAWDGFELAVRAILGQQVSVAAATRLAGRLVAAFGTPVVGEMQEAGLSHAFPGPEALVEADVALALNMPRTRGAAIQALAAAALAEPDLFAPGAGLAASVERLKRLRGIGDWTAQYIAMRALREADAMPTGDIGLLRALEDAAGRPSARALEMRSGAWRPWRAYAVMHLWAHDAARSAVKP
ncbi:DNA-3-methyladenine glycosylase family protein [Methylobacterium dankookense]|uniref:DNA-3-methyladenine glycosylase II n=1 Tax=Methylobacterium dankookense TaxID=560405 RepID=A0A564FUX4_9HYPH|nr:AlkA N-terminal domain-containing protein [Methylobacterium dankookense]GJD54961.1 putative bifunctional transcriptional activator/DNA repair enzyme AlkA [Methylobacterium dankookense]VUF11959.1 putative bifunctional transcriptional activator/DNA repair enzyme AlkA [Methylobacterium dankookense]